MLKALWAATIFLSAFLVFQIQPLIAKLLLPWFGGAAAVWTTSLVFFQAMLLLGYAYAHGLTKWVPSQFQPWIHTFLLASSLLAIPIHLRAGMQLEDPSWRVLASLAASVGLPYLFLTTTSPLLQAWYPRGSSTDVYRFYALSNAGSMLAVLSYPVLFEPFFSLRHQAGIWSGAYLAACAGCGAASYFRKKQAATEPVEVDSQRPSRGTIALWVTLPACSTALLLAITNHQSQNLAAIPLLWVISLSLYLLSFILAFASRNFYPRHFYLRLLAVTLGAISYALAPHLGNPSLILLIPLYSASLFVCCMVCHGELARLKPGRAHLTFFYFTMSLGSALGGVFVALIAPRVFDGFHEFQLALGGCAILAVVVIRRDPESPFFKATFQPAWLVVVALAMIINASLWFEVYRQHAAARLMVRNFYGVLRETETQSSPSTVNKPPTRERTLLNGSIRHGSQFLSDDRRREPTSYYGRRSGVGLAFEAARTDVPLRVGAVGLGVGTVAAYGKSGDEFTFYELNPLVTEVARRDFTYLGDSAARIRILEGDARLTLEHQEPQNFDLLVADAFSGDAIPVHLLTREAFEIYFRHLKPQGVLAVHISNSYLRLQPVVASAAAVMGKPAVEVYSKGNDEEGTASSRWILVTSNRTFLASPAIRASAVRAAPDPNVPLWTDDYSNLIGILKWALD